MASTEAKVIHHFHIPAAKVFDAWLDEDQVRLWMKAALISFGLSGEVRRVEIDPRQGGRFTFSDMREDEVEVHWGTYREIDRPHKLAFSWFTSEEEEKEDNSLVTLRFEEENSGCTVTLTHTMAERYAEYIPQTRRGWKVMLEEIENLLLEK